MSTELERVNGTSYTRWDCPSCGDCNEVEGDATGDKLMCEMCRKEVLIGEVT